MTKYMAAQPRIAQGGFSAGPVTAAYERKVDAGEVQRDEAQAALAAKLDALHESLTSFPPLPARSLASAQSFLRKKFHLWSFGPPPRGIYIHGSVGVGKSFLMDLFCELVASPQFPRQPLAFLNTVFHTELEIAHRCSRGDVLGYRTAQCN